MKKNSKGVLYTNIKRMQLKPIASITSRENKSCAEIITEALADFIEQRKQSYWKTIDRAPINKRKLCFIGITGISKKILKGIAFFAKKEKKVTEIIIEALDWFIDKKVTECPIEDMPLQVIL